MMTLLLSRQLILMIKRQSGNRSLKDILDSNSFVVCHLPQNVAEIKCHRSRKVNLKILVIRILHYIVLVKLRKTIVHELVIIVIFQMMLQKLRERCQERAWFFLLVNFFKEFFAVEWISLAESFGKMGGKLFTQIINK